ncbi:EF-hand domain-containing protein [Jannaschia sp. CCS1]|uniref:EF-hand domain-containing protein n=1 Tax=Jannaschia sp. (strain CCS1) TaxID=290400 RepID=UPI0000539FEB|nr:EF-hand domain-containing protein [Jannaschia sp. CCS1]ABD56917.1 Calcium-binding EF-hand [Jannaschia sp. CCS1]
MTRILAAIILSASVGIIAPMTPANAQFEAQSVQFFRAADVNGDERLTLGEFRTFIQSMAAAGAPMSQRIVRLAAYRVAFRRVDTNGDGVATPEELRAAERAN